MYKNLKSALRAKGITQETAAKEIGVTPRALIHKLNGETDFTVSEALQIWWKLLPEYQFVLLFAKDEENA